MPQVPPFVDAAWVAARPGAVLADVRFALDGRDVRAGYDAGHLPGAVYVDLARVLSGPASADAGRHPLPDPATFAEALGAAGLAEDDVVVAYDDAGGTVAARLVWMLRALGGAAALLDGGAAGALDVLGPLEQTDRRREPVVRPVRRWPAGLLTDLDGALAAVTAASTVLLDARPPERFRGDSDPVDVRAGHVPGARNLPARASVDDSGWLLPEVDLRARLAAAGVGPGTAVVSSCGSGVTACHTLLVLEHLGLPPGRLWPGSWSQYAGTDRPVATGP